MFSQYKVLSQQAAKGKFCNLGAYRALAKRAPPAWDYNHKNWKPVGKDQQVIHSYHTGGSPAFRSAMAIADANASTLNFPIHRSANWYHFRVTAEISHLNNDPTGFICDFCLFNIFILVMFWGWVYIPELIHEGKRLVLGTLLLLQMKHYIW